MKTNDVIRVVLLLNILSVLASCASGKCGFSVNKQYTSSGFNSKEFSGRSVIIMPLLKANGLDTIGPLTDTSMLKKISEIRRDLFFKPFSQNLPEIQSRFSESTINTFIKELYTGNLSALQTSDSIWGSINADYMITIRLNCGHTVHTFNRETHKKIVLEGELWDCKRTEVAIRIIVNGICISSSITDDNFIVDGVKEIVREFPISSPAYDTQAW